VIGQSAVSQEPAVAVVRARPGPAVSAWLGVEWAAPDLRGDIVVNRRFLMPTVFFLAAAATAAIDPNDILVTASLEPVQVQNAAVSATIIDQTRMMRSVRRSSAICFGSPRVYRYRFRAAAALLPISVSGERNHATACSSSTVSP